jgi:hypothetical protein
MWKIIIAGIAGPFLIGVGRMPRIARPPIERFLEKFEVDSNTGCWLWTASKNYDGYSQLKWNGKAVAAHIFSYTHYKGSIPEEMEIDHLCQVRHCVNPDNLEAVPHLVNMKRGDLFKTPKANSLKTHCPAGHEYTKENTKWENPSRTGKVKTRKCLICRRIRDRKRYNKGIRLNEIQVSYIRNNPLNYSKHMLAKMFNKSYHTIYSIQTYKTWKEL